MLIELHQSTKPINLVFSFAALSSWPQQKGITPIQIHYVSVSVNTEYEQCQEAELDITITQLLMPSVHNTFMIFTSKYAFWAKQTRFNLNVKSGCQYWKKYETAVLVVFMTVLIVSK